MLFRGDKGFDQSRLKGVSNLDPSSVPGLEYWSSRPGPPIFPSTSRDCCNTSPPHGPFPTGPSPTGPMTGLSERSLSTGIPVSFSVGPSGLLRLRLFLPETGHYKEVLLERAPVRRTKYPLGVTCHSSASEALSQGILEKRGTYQAGITREDQNFQKLPLFGVPVPVWTDGKYG